MHYRNTPETVHEILISGSKDVKKKLPEIRISFLATRNIDAIVFTKASQFPQ